MKWILIVGGIVIAIPALMALLGLALPVAHVASRKAVVAAKPEELFQKIAGPSDWRGVKYEPLGSGQWRETEGHDAIVFERVETAPPARIVNRIADKTLPFGGTWTYEIAPSGVGSELTITENGEVYNPLFRFVSRFIMGHTATIDKYLADLAKVYAGR
jgi:hypothetical protein